MLRAYFHQNLLYIYIYIYIVIDYTLITTLSVNMSMCIISSSILAFTTVNGHTVEVFHHSQVSNCEAIRVRDFRLKPQYR